jgi:hypothetical protein
MISSFATFLILGMILVSTMAVTKYEMSSVINIGRTVGIDQLVEPVAAAMNRLNVLLVPSLTKTIIKEYDISIFKTNISNPKDTDLIVIENTVTDESRESMAQFQRLALDTIIAAHDELFEINNRELQKNVSGAKLKLAELESPLYRLKLIRNKLSELQLARLELFKSSDSAYLDQQRVSYRDNIRLRNDGIQVNEDLNRELKIQGDAFRSDGETNSRPISAIEVEIIGNRNKINELQLQKTILNQQLVIFELEIKPKAEHHEAIVKALESETELIKFNLKNEVQQQKQVILALEKQLGGSKSRAIAIAESSLSSIGLSQTASYALTIFMAFIIAGFITLAAMFRSKVNERLTTEA